MYKNITKKIQEILRFWLANWVFVHFVHFAKSVYNNTYTHTRTPYITIFLVINLYIIRVYLFYLFYFKKFVQNVQFLCFKYSNANIFCNSFCTVCNHAPKTF